ncbi:MAG TPA: LuxR C-terminal-related transcriptional regulator [Actinomycetota bacterium]|nr:LuxR C-terminal-related transcriptional regulator [Actinomycetota bacterium]
MLADRDAPVVTINAPAGFGKTSLVSQWLEADDRAFISIAADDPFFSVSEAFLLAAELIVGSDPVVLVIDDAQLMKDADVEALLERVGQFRPSCQLVLVGRRSLPGVARLRSEGRLLEIGMPDLAMDLDEAGALIRSVAPHLPADDVHELWVRTEGWSAGLYLAALARRELEGSTAPLDGNERYLAEYLRAEVLSHLSRAQTRFLVRSSALTSLSGPLCDAALRRTGSAGVLRQIERSGAMLIPLDALGKEYRLHPLLQDFLRADLTGEAGAEAMIARRASLWCERHDLIDSAIEYASIADDPDRVAALFGAHGLDVAWTGRIERMQEWLDWLDERAPRDRYPTIAFFRTWINLLLGREREAALAAKVAQDARISGPMPDGSSHEAWVHLLRAALCREGIDAMEKDARLATEALEPYSPWQPTASLLLGIAVMLAGDLEEADHHLADAIEMGEERFALITMSVAFAERSFIAILEGRWSDAAGFAEHACELTDREPVRPFATHALAHVAAARVARHRGEADVARAHLAIVEESMPALTGALPYLAIQARLMFARCALALGDEASARQRSDEIRELIRRAGNLDKFLPSVDEVGGQLLAAEHKVAKDLRLTGAELRLIPLLATQLTFREIGEQLHLSQHTVKAEAISIYRKLGETSRSRAVERSRSLGLLPD